MRVINDDILTIKEVSGVEVSGICFTANKVIDKGYRAVMGAGVAKIFRDIFTGVDITYGDIIRLNGSSVSTTPLGLWDLKGRVVEVIAFPTKNHWRGKSNLDLIRQSSIDLCDLIDSRMDLKRGVVLLPKPGCGLGGLTWETVEPVLDEILPENVIIVDKLGMK